jgi:hypothetical protein
MNRLLLPIIATLWCLLGIAVQAAGVSYQPIAPGVSYAHIVDKSVPWSIHVTKFDYARRDLKLTTTLAHNTILGLAKVRDQVAAMPTSAGRPIAAINGDFFLIDKKPYQGDPRGLQIFNGELIRGPWRDVTFWVDNAGKPHMGEVKAQFKVTWPNSTTIDVGLNEVQAPNRATLLTPILGPSTRTSNVVEMVLRDEPNHEWLPVHSGRTYFARVADVNASGNASLSADTMVLSVGSKLARRLPATPPGTELTVTLALKPDLKDVQTAIGGGPALVHRGKSLHKPQTGKADHLRQRNPRTAIGWNNREFFMVVVDGRKPGLSLGMDFPELAAEMIGLGCDEAMNLDGGGSTTMWLQGKIVNRPSEGAERRVANCLVLVQSP